MADYLSGELTELQEYIGGADPANPAYHVGAHAITRFASAYVSIDIGTYANTDIVRLFQVRTQHRPLELRVYCQTGLSNATFDLGYYYTEEFREGGMLVTPPYPSPQAVGASRSDRSISQGFDLADGHNGQDLMCDIRSVSGDFGVFTIKNQGGYQTHFEHWQKCAGHSGYGTFGIPHTLDDDPNETWDLSMTWTDTPAGSMSQSGHDGNPFVVFTLLYTTA